MEGPCHLQRWELVLVSRASDALPALHPQPQSLWREEKGSGARGLGAGFVWMTGMQMADDKMLEAGAGRSCHRRLAALV